MARAVSNTAEAALTKLDNTKRGIMGMSQRKRAF